MEKLTFERIRKECAYEFNPDTDLLYNMGKSIVLNPYNSYGCTHFINFITKKSVFMEDHGGFTLNKILKNPLAKIIKPRWDVYQYRLVKTHRKVTEKQNIEKDFIDVEVEE